MANEALTIHIELVVHRDNQAIDNFHSHQTTRGFSQPFSLARLQGYYKIQQNRHKLKNPQKPVKIKGCGILEHTVALIYFGNRYIKSLYYPLL